MKFFRKMSSIRVTLFKPETPVLLFGFLAALIVIVLSLIVLWSTFLVELPNWNNIFSFSLNNFIDVFTYPLVPEAAVNTAILAIGSMFVALFFAIPIAWLVTRTNVNYKRIFITLMFIHSLLPGFIKVMGWIMLISPDIGVVNQLIRSLFPAIKTGPLNPYNITFMCFLQGITLTPTLFLMISGAFIAIDPSFEESAEANGLNRLRVLRYISFPLVKPAIVAGFIYLFAMTVSMFEIPALLGLPHNIHVFSTLMFQAIQPDIGMPKFGMAGVYGIILLVPTGISFYYYQKMIKLSHRYTTVTGKGYKPKTMDLGKWIRRFATAFIILYFVVDLILPFLAILWTSLLPFIQLPSMSALQSITLDGFRQSIEILSSYGAVSNTIIVTVTTAIVSVLVGLIFSWIALRTKIPGRYAFDNISMLPHVVPGICYAFAVAFIGIMIIKYVPLYGSVAAIILADSIKRFPFTTRTISSSLIQIHPELEEAVLTSGGSKVVALKKVIMPLVIPAILYSFIWAFLQAYREVTTALFLTSPRNRVLSTTIWNLWANGRDNVAAASAVMMIFTMGIIILIILRFFPQITQGGNNRRMKRR